LAKHFNVPFYCLTQPAADTRSRKDVEIEFRPKEELLRYGRKFIAPPTQKALYPAFDITPAEYITKLICFDGAFSPEEFRKRWQK
ncbi:MAG: S-methyl-5-thioribose-1-phosphate isomerase, partial [Candidatus Omnitrophica bacterium]|nr:S-methyl-5-thioribose-1-phosphate isomerase [Candidatus Omnitrophota bacterium]